MSNDLCVLLSAADLLRDRPEICFVFVGDGKEKPLLQQMADKMGLRNTLFLPPVPKASMGEVVAAADACVAILKPLDLYKTTYPNKVFDYMAAGRPVLLAIDGVIRSVLETAGAGLFVPPGNPPAMANAILQLANDPASARAMGLAGREAVERNFDRQALAEKLALLVEDMRGVHATKNSDR
jgi:glycosyltransferase involved in cell wall biosynthesis